MYSPTIAQLQAQIEKLTAELAHAQASIKVKDDAIKALTEVIDVDSLLKKQ